MIIIVLYMHVILFNCLSTFELLEIDAIQIHFLLLSAILLLQLIINNCIGVLCNAQPLLSEHLWTTVEIHDLGI